MQKNYKYILWWQYFDYTGKGIVDTYMEIKDALRDKKLLEDHGDSLKKFIISKSICK